MNHTRLDRGARLCETQNLLAWGLALITLPLSACSREERAAGGAGPTREVVDGAPHQATEVVPSAPREDPVPDAQPVPGEQPVSGEDPVMGEQPTPNEDGVPTVPLDDLDAEVAALLQARVDAVRGALEDAAAWGALAQAYDTHSYLGEALTCFERAVELAPQDVTVRLAVASFLGRHGFHEEAESQLKEAAALLDARDPVPAEDTNLRAELALQRGRATLALGRLDEAAGHFEAALTLDASLEIARGNLGLVRLREGRTANGMQLLRQACAALGPGNSALQSLLGGVLDAGLWTEAETLAVELLRASPDDTLLLFVRGRAHAGQKRFKEAARDFARVAELAPQHESAPVNEARAYLAVGDEEHAAAALRAAHERMPESRLIMQRLAWLLATAHEDSVADGHRAKDLALRVLAAAPKSPEYLTLAAAAFAAASDFNAAVMHEELALKFLAGLPAELAPPRRDELTAAMQARLAEYRAQRRWREKPPTAAGTK